MFETSIIEYIFVEVSISVLFLYRCKAVIEVEAVPIMFNVYDADTGQFRVYLKHFKSLGIIGIVMYTSISTGIL